MPDRASSRIPSNRQRLDHLAEKIFNPQPSRFAIAEPAPSNKPIADPNQIARHELEAAYIYEFARESFLVRQAVKALKVHYSDTKSRHKKKLAEKACYELNDIRMAISDCLANTSYPCDWIKLPIPERQRLIAVLPATVNDRAKTWPLNILDADIGSPPLSAQECYNSVVQPVGAGIIRTGYFAANLVEPKKEIVAEFVKWLDRQCASLGYYDHLMNTRKPGPDGWKSALECLKELRFRCWCKVEGKTFNEGKTFCKVRGRSFTRPSDSNNACEAAMKAFVKLFGDSEMPINADWRKRPKRKKIDSDIPPAVRRKLERDRREFADMLREFSG